jgi:CBS domain-containing protein
MDGVKARQPVGGVMRRHWVAVSPGLPLREALQLMRVARLRQLPVVTGGVLLGVLSYRTVVEAVVAGRGERVGDVMRPEMETGEASMPVGEAAARLVRSQAGFLPIVEPGPGGPRLVGLVTESDLLRLAYDPVRGDDVTPA